MDNINEMIELCEKTIAFLTRHKDNSFHCAISLPLWKQKLEYWQALKE